MDLPSHHITITAGVQPHTDIHSSHPLRVTGAIKPDYGTFSVELDGRPALNASSFSQTQTFRRKLFQLRDLPTGFHAVRVINTGPGFDVDTVSCYLSCR